MLKCFYHTISIGKIMPNSLTATADPHMLASTNASEGIPMLWKNRKLC